MKKDRRDEDLRRTNNSKVEEVTVAADAEDAAAGVEEVESSVA